MLYNKALKLILRKFDGFRGNLTSFFSDRCWSVSSDSIVTTLLPMTLHLAKYRSRDVHGQVSGSTLIIVHAFVSLIDPGLSSPLLYGSICKHIKSTLRASLQLVADFVVTRHEDTANEEIVHRSFIAIRSNVTTKVEQQYVFFFLILFFLSSHDESKTKGEVENTSTWKTCDSSGKKRWICSLCLLQKRLRDASWKCK